MVYFKDVENITDEQMKYFYTAIFYRGSVLLGEKADNLVLLRSDDNDFERDFRVYRLYDYFNETDIVFRSKVPGCGVKAWVNTYFIQKGLTRCFMSLKSVNNGYIIVSKKAADVAMRSLTSSTNVERHTNPSYAELRKFLEKTFDVSEVHSIEFFDNYDPFEGGSNGFTMKFWCNGKPKKFGNILLTGRINFLDKCEYREIGTGKWELRGTNKWLTDFLIKFLNRYVRGLGLESRNGILYNKGSKIKELEIRASRFSRPVIMKMGYDMEG